MKNWTNSIALALAAATLTLTAACTEDGPSSIGPAEAEDSITVNGVTMSFPEYHLRYVFPTQVAAASAALDEIERTFSVEDFRSGLYAERWPEIWGPDGWAQNVSHYDAASRLHSRLDFRMTDRYGRDWKFDDATVAAARAELKTDLDRYMFDGFVRFERELRESRERSLRKMRERQDSLAALEVKR